MDRNHYQRVMEIFELVRDVEPDHRARILADLCKDDANLRAEVEELVRHDQRPVGILRTTSEGGGVALLADSIQREEVVHGAIPRRIGRYAITRLIGEGGMGTVYEAQQEQPRRTVALKMLRGGLASPSLLKRFGYEAQVLGRLQHSGIAQIIEFGVASTDSGDQPFLVMEFVSGQRLDEYVRDHNLSIRERLQLFLKVCDAVQHAHQKGVVHRDLKPANILVMSPESSSRGVSTDGAGSQSREAVVGQPKVLDFGLAKIVESDVTLTAMATEAGRVQGTLAYMSPEQAKGRSDAIDVRSDVYSLGVILYELLAGQLPYDVSRMTLPEAVRVICKDAPRRPGAVSKTLRGDLETIAFKALEKEPERRYASVASLAEDVDRYLGSQPILARRPSATYQLGKLISRHKLPFAFAAALFVLVLCFGIWMTILYARAESSRVRAVAAEITSSIEAQTAKQTTAFLVNLFKVSDPSESRGNSVTAREVLDRGADRVRAELNNQPIIQASLMDAIGNVYLNLGLHNAATPFIEEAAELRRAQLGEDSMAYAESLESLAILKDEKGDTVDPVPLLRKALTIRLKHKTADKTTIANLQNSLGGALFRKGNLNESEAMYRQSLETRKVIFGEEHADVAESLTNLGAVLREKGANEEAETILRRALAIQRKTLDPNHPFIAGTDRFLAEILQIRGKFDEALPLFREALDIDRKVYGPDHPRVGQAVEGMAKITYLQGDFAAAVLLYREALRIQLLTLSEEHGDVVNTINNLGGALYRLGDMRGAAEMWERALALTKKRVGPEHGDVATALNNLAVIYWENEEWEKAVNSFEESLAIKEKQTGRVNADVALTVDNLGSVYRDRGDLKRSEPLLLEAMETRKKMLGPDHPDYALSLNNVGELRLAQGDAAGAEPYLIQSHDIFLKKLGPKHAYLAYPLLELGRARLGLNDPIGAETHFRKALEIRTAALEPGSAELAKCKSWLGAALLAQRRFGDAQPLLIQGFVELQKAKGISHRETRLAHSRLMALYGTVRPSFMPDGIEHNFDIQLLPAS